MINLSNRYFIDALLSLLGYLSLFEYISKKNGNSNSLTEQF